MKYINSTIYLTNRVLTTHQVTSKKPGTAVMERGGALFSGCMDVH